MARCSCGSWSTGVSVSFACRRSSAGLPSQGVAGVDLPVDSGQLPVEVIVRLGARLEFLELGSDLLDQLLPAAAVLVGVAGCGGGHGDGLPGLCCGRLLLRVHWVVSYRLEVHCALSGSFPGYSSAYSSVSRRVASA